MLRKLVKIILVIAFILVYGIIGSNDYHDKMEEIQHSGLPTHE